VRVQFQASRCGDCDGQRGTRIGFSGSTLFFPVSVSFHNAKYFLIHFANAIKIGN
jgi:hypothetical protein